MSTQIQNVSRPEGISDRVWEDFVSVHINGERPTDVARNSTPPRASATVSANVKRMREKLGIDASEAAPRQNGEGSSQVTVTPDTALTAEDKYKIADALVPPFGRMYVHEYERMQSNAPTTGEVDKAREALRKAEDALTEAETRHAAQVESHTAQMDAFIEAASAVGFDFDAYNEQVALSEEEARVLAEMTPEDREAALVASGEAETPADDDNDTDE